jgi:dienelactone hydrolase
MHTISETRLDLGGVPGILWTPERADPAPLLLLGHPGDLTRMHPRLLGRAQRAAASGFAAATLELPGAGGRPLLPDVEAARAELRATIGAGAPVGADLVDRLVLPLVERAVPEWSALLDELLARPGIAGPVGYSGGFISIGVRLAAVDPRIAAAGLFAGSYVPRAIVEDARRLAIPVHVLLQWDDEGNDRTQALELFDAFGSAEKTLQANLGGHTGVPAFAGEDAARFFERHLRPTASAGGS